MATHDAQHRRPRQGRVDFTLMYAAHDAFERDLRRLTTAVVAGRGADPATRAGWATLKNQLHIHHTVEDVALWPPLRKKAVRPAEVEVLDAMEAEHAGIDPLLARIDAAFAASDRPVLADVTVEFAAAMQAHMHHEEQKALPLVEQHLGPEGWGAFLDAIRQRQGLRGGAEFLPWLLDDASPEKANRVLHSLPAPARVLYRVVWRRGYARTPRWTGAGTP